MNKILYDSGPMDADRRFRAIVTKTDKGIEVEQQSAYDDTPVQINFFRDGNYPPLPVDWSASINDYTSAAELFIHQLGGYTPDRLIDPYARRLGTLGGQKTSDRKAQSSAANGKKGGRPRRKEN